MSMSRFVVLLCILSTGSIVLVKSERTTDDDLVEVEIDALCPKGSFSYDGYGYNTEEFPCELCGPGEFGDVEGLDECGICPPGSFTPDLGFWECMQCPKGSIADQDFSYECYPCYFGQYSPVEGGTSCENCPVGRYQNEEGQGDCKICPPGQYQDTPASQSCGLCPAGESCPAESTSSSACSPCPAGQHASVAGSACVPCPILTYTDETGATACKDCPSNTETEGATSCSVSCPSGQVDVDGTCTPCPVGTYEVDATCSPCPSGSYNSITGATQCAQCPAGSFSAEPGASGCEPCPVRTYGPTAGLDVCLDCPGNSEEGMTECRVECPAGFVENEDGNCEACPAGTFEIEGECESCPGGQFASDAASVQCEPCTEGHYCPPGTAEPSLCSAGEFCPAAASSPSLCPAGTYNPSTGSVSSASCLACPGGYYCEGEGQSDTSGQCSAGYFCPEGSTSAEEEISPPGTFSPAGSSAATPCPKNTYRSEEGGVTVHDCEHCPPGQETDGQGTTSPDMCKDVICNPGYYRDMEEGCVICAAGSFSTLQNADSCTPCPKNMYNSVPGSDACLKCPDTAYTWDEGSDSFDKCIGPVIQICTEENLTGRCAGYYDDNLQADFPIASLIVIRGEFEVYTGVNHGGDYTVVKETDGALNVRDIFPNTDDQILSFKPLLNNVYCYFEKGAEFRGTFRTSAANGKPCLNWADTPMADKTTRHDNHCQNPEGVADEPFCYTSETEASPCGIPACIWDIDCYTGIGAGYRGSQFRTEHTKTCQNWESNWPHPISSKYRDADWAGVGDHNLCRNPDTAGTGKPWCFTTSLNPYYWWDYCTVERCNRDQFQYYRF